VSGDDNDEPQKEVNNNRQYQQQGWALSESKTGTRYSPEQIKYLTDKYNEGEAGGHKWNSSAVSSVSNLKIAQILRLNCFSGNGDKREKWTICI
jgi:hypothetical protein